MSRWRARVRRFFKFAALTVMALVGAALVDGWRAFGKGAGGERLARMQKSPQYKDGHFENPEPLHNDTKGSLTAMFHADPNALPEPPLVVPPIDRARFASAPPTGLRVTWLGHSTNIIEVDGHRFLTDPVWSHRVGPIDGIGPTRWFEQPIALEDLPSFDAVLVSHDHYDHLDRPTVMQLIEKTSRFIVPLGVGAHLEYWGVPNAKIVEVDWWDHVDANGLEIVCTPARHASGRALWDKDATLWASYAFLGDKHRVWFSGDTGLFPAMDDIGTRFGPFDLTMIEVGQYHQAWPDWHIGPEQALRAHKMVRGKVFLPIHWGALRLAIHAWTEPAERARAEALRRALPIVLPKPGESFEPEAKYPTEPWWPKIPWKTGAEDPIVSSQVPPEQGDSSAPPAPTGR